MRAMASYHPPCLHSPRVQPLLPEKLRSTIRAKSCWIGRQSGDTSLIVSDAEHLRAARRLRLSLTPHDAWSGRNRASLLADGSTRGALRRSQVICLTTRSQWSGFGTTGTGRDVLHLTALGCKADARTEKGSTAPLDRECTGGEGEVLPT